MPKYQKEFDRWFANDGDRSHLLNHKLDSNSIVIDAGGFVGDFSFDINTMSGSKIFTFEPVGSFYRHICERLKNESNIKIFNFGISSNDKQISITLDGDASSFHTHGNGKLTEQCTIRDVDNVLSELGIENIDLFKINIEGDEFDLIARLIETGRISKIKFLQVQFHDFIENAEEKRMNLQEKLRLTHNCEFSYDFVWEGWSLR